MVTVLLATYNGSKYIREQIDSLLSQTYKDFNILVHDDGS
ncbi:MAG: glycosyltransferase, partial [Clostridia bacterium]|nr:glycosyltransferase [Clostridia bacterium]